MQVKNVTKKTILTKELSIPSHIERIRGNIARNKTQSLLIKTRFGIHTIGVRYKLDILILNKERVVVSLKRSLKPNSVYFWHPQYDIVIELPEGTIKESKTVIGDQLVIV